MHTSKHKGTRDARAVITMHQKRLPFDMLHCMRRVHQWCLWKLPHREYPCLELRALATASQMLISRMEKRATLLSEEEATRYRAFYLAYIQRVRQHHKSYVESAGHKSMRRGLMRRKKMSLFQEALLEERADHKAELSQFKVPPVPLAPIPPPKPLDIHPPSDDDDFSL